MHQPESDIHPMKQDCFALLDDCNATDADPRSRLYTFHVGTLICNHARELERLFESMQQSMQQGLYAVGVFAYEFGAESFGIAPRPADQPLAQILLFQRCQRLSAAQVACWLEEKGATQSNGKARTGAEIAGVGKLHPDTSKKQFFDAIHRIHSYLQAGDSYQVNYTYRMHFEAYGSVYQLYRKLRARQPVPYGALIGLPDGRAVLSLSPELFIRHEQGKVTAMPMKGTAAATGIPEHDAQSAALLASDAKNCAENVMIVDLLRNDLGRIAKTGSVQVPRLFEVNAYGAVLQMTSTITATLQPHATLAGLFAALYPCGSIVGAPKRRTMQIIHELEPAARGIYTGAIGWFDKPLAPNGIGDFCLSVPIRTLVLQPPGLDGMRKGELGVGAGIVNDSDAAAEYAECRLKAAFLTGLPAEFELLETLLATRRNGCRHLDLHLQRLRTSAQYFGFCYDEGGLRNALEHACLNLPTDGRHRVRLALMHSGNWEITSEVLMPDPDVVHVLIGPQPIEHTSVFLRHKTTMREHYDAAWREVQARNAFDMLFYNRKGEMAEGIRSNLFIKLDGQWLTPPLEAGLLPGVMRTVLLTDPAWNAQERMITIEDLRSAEAVVVCNSLRGALPAIVDWADSPSCNRHMDDAR